MGFAKLLNRLDVLLENVQQILRKKKKITENLSLFNTENFM